jgi:exodeoxyribonuclease X
MTDHRAWSELSYMVVDVEGNGDRPPRLVECAAVPIVAGVIGQPRSWLMKPATPIAWQARKVHGITNEQVADLPGVETVRDDIAAVLADHVIVGHNVHIDLDVLTRELPDWQPTGQLDTLRLARRLLLELSSHRLGALVDHFGLAAGLPSGLQPHRATYDVLVTAELLRRLATIDGADRTVDDLQEFGALVPAAAEEHEELRLFE